MASQTVDCARFDEYVDRLTAVVGHADRRWPLTAYLTGLLLPGKRKSIEPMAAKIDPRHVSRAHQSMHHFVAFGRPGLPVREGPPGLLDLSCTSAVG